MSTEGSGSIDESADRSAAQVSEHVSAHAGEVTLPKTETTMLEGFRERKTAVTSAIMELAQIALGIGAKGVADKVSKMLVAKLDEDRFHLVIVGEFNHGKTTFVNALLGERALPAGVTPTTATIHHLKYSDVPEACVAYSSGRRESIPFQDARKFAVGGESSVDGVDYLEIGYPAPLLRERILLVDTPGVNDLSLSRADITYSYIPRADAVLFLLDAGQILKESERVFLQEKLLKASRDKIVFVITKWDLLTSDEQAEALAYAKLNLSRLVRDPVVFPVSAEKVLDGNAAESGFPELLTHLTKFLAEERGRIMLDNALGEGLNVAALLEKGVDARRRSMLMKVDELDRRIAAIESDLLGQAGTLEQRRMKIREEVGGIRASARKDLERFVDDVLAQLPHVIDSAKSGDLKQYLPAFLEDSFRKWAEVETKEIAGSLEALAEKIVALVREDAHDTAKRVAGVLGVDSKRLDVHIDTFAYDIGVVGLLLGGVSIVLFNWMLGVILIAAGPVLALVMKEKIDGEVRKKAKELAPDVVRQAAEKVGPKLDEMIDDFGKKLDAWVVSAGEELHRELLDVLRSTKVARESGGSDDATLTSEIDKNHAALTAATSNIEAMRKALWTPVATAAADTIVAPDAVSQAT